MRKGTDNRKKKELTGRGIKEKISSGEEESGMEMRNDIQKKRPDEKRGKTGKEREI